MDLYCTCIIYQEIDGISNLSFTELINEWPVSIWKLSENETIEDIQMMEHINMGCRVSFVNNYSFQILIFIFFLFFK